MLQRTAHNEKTLQEITHIVKVVTDSVERDIKRKSRKKKSCCLFRLSSKYKQIRTDEQNSAIETIRNLRQSSLIVTPPEQPRLMQSRKMGIAETSEIERKVIQKILKNFMVSENMREYFLID